MPNFNLIDEPWLPCVTAAPDDGAPATVQLSLREILLRAHELAAVTGESPPVTAALYRLLLAVLHRCAGEDDQTGPKDAARWEVLWNCGRFDADAINRYLAEQRPHFDLFDAERPFYQTAGPAVDEGKAASIAKLLFQSDNNPTLFDHAIVADPPRLSPARAARLVVAYQAFDTGG